MLNVATVPILEGCCRCILGLFLMAFFLWSLTVGSQCFVVDIGFRHSVLEETVDMDADSKHNENGLDPSLTEPCRWDISGHCSPR